MDRLERVIKEATDALRELVGASRSEAVTPLGAEACLVILAENDEFILPGGQSLVLRHRGPARRLLLALVEHREKYPGAAMTVDAAFAAGWPDQRAHPEAAAGRVYTTVRVLRNLGLREWVLRRDDGYVLSSHLTIIRR